MFVAFIDMTTLENPHRTEISVIAEGRAYFDRCTALMRLTFRSSGLSFRFMSKPAQKYSIAIFPQAAQARPIWELNWIWRMSRLQNVSFASTTELSGCAGI
jgi:hypothetical protein